MGRGEKTRDRLSAWLMVLAVPALALVMFAVATTNVVLVVISAVTMGVWVVTALTITRAGTLDVAPAAATPVVDLRGTVTTARPEPMPRPDAIDLRESRSKTN